MSNDGEQYPDRLETVRKLDALIIVDLFSDFLGTSFWVSDLLPESASWSENRTDSLRGYQSPQKKASGKLAVSPVMCGCKTARRIHLIVDDWDYLISLLCTCLTKGATGLLWISLGCPNRALSNWWPIHSALEDGQLGTFWVSSVSVLSIQICVRPQLVSHDFTVSAAISSTLWHAAKGRSSWLSLENRLIGLQIFPKKHGWLFQ